MLFLWRKQTDRRFEGKRVGRGSRVSFKSFDKTFLLVLRLPKLTLFLIPQIFFSSSYYYFFFPIRARNDSCYNLTFFPFFFCTTWFVSIYLSIKSSKNGDVSNKNFQNPKVNYLAFKIWTGISKRLLGFEWSCFVGIFFFNHLQGRHKKKNLLVWWST